MYEKILHSGLLTQVRDLYSDLQSTDLIFHNWNHVHFVTKSAAKFAQQVNAAIELTTTAALLHDLNYFFGTTSGPEAGQQKRTEILRNHNFEAEFMFKVEETIVSAHTAYRGNSLTLEAQCLSDADSLFKAIPVTPVLNARKYCKETGMSLRDLAEKVVSEQKPLLEKDIYFYTDYARMHYLHFAQTNLDLWTNILAWFDSDSFDEAYSDFDDA